MYKPIVKATPLAFKNQEMSREISLDRLKFMSTYR